MSSPDLFALASAYFNADKACKKAIYEEKKAKEDLCKALGLEPKELTKEEYKDFVSRQIDIPGVVKATLYANHKCNPNWEYLQEILKASQLTQAQKFTYFSQVRLTAGFDIK